MEYYYLYVEDYDLYMEEIHFHIVIIDSIHLCSAYKVCCTLSIPDMAASTLVMSDHTHTEDCD